MYRCLLIVVTIASLASAADQPAVEINGTRARVTFISPEDAAKMKAAGVIDITFKKEATDEGFATIRRTPWVTRVELEFGNENISSFEPISACTSLERFTSRTQKMSKTKRFSVKPFAKMTSLHELDFYATRIADTDALAGLTKLRRLSFYMSAVDSIECVRTMRDLEDLSLYGSQHTFPDYEPIRGLPKLKKLNLYMNKVPTDKLPVVGSLTALEEFTLMFNPATHINFLKPCTKMKYLNINWNKQLTDITAVAGMKELTTIDIRDSVVSDISALTNCPKLNNVSIEGTKVTDLNAFAKLPNLRRLDASEIAISDLSPLAKCPNISYLKLNKTNVSDISPLAGLTHLTTLDLASTKVTDVTALANCKALFRLTVPTAVPDEQIEALKKNAKRLRSVRKSDK